MESTDEKMDEDKLLEEACFPIMLIWERINHAYTSDSVPKDWGLQKGEYGFQTWVFPANNERYTVVWDRARSYWKVNSPFGECFFYNGPHFIDKTRNGLHVPPLLTVVNSTTDVLIPASSYKVAEKMLRIARYVVKPCLQVNKTN